MFKVLTTPQKPKPDYNKLYREAYIKKAQEFIDNPSKQLKKQLIFYGVKLINTNKENKDNYEHLIHQFKFIDTIRRFIADLTPLELLTIFPLDKYYNGEKHQIKDYFYSMKKLHEIGMDKPIGDNIDELLWDYENIHLTHFNVNLFGILSDIRKLEGHKSLIEDFFESQGKPLTTYTLHQDKKGRKFMINNTTGETARVRSKIPRYLKPVKS